MSSTRLSRANAVGHPEAQANREHGRRQRREQMERRLLDATELSVDRLSSEAGISRASFYIYFEDKGHLLRRLTSSKRLRNCCTCSTFASMTAISMSAGTALSST